jgi:hypothetical protein
MIRRETRNLMKPIKGIEFQIRDKQHNCTFMASEVEFLGDHIVIKNTDPACFFAQVECPIHQVKIHYMGFPEKNNPVLRIEIEL